VGAGTGTVAFGWKGGIGTSYNSLFTATTVSAKGGTVEAIPVAEVRRILDGHGMLQR
jgi:L-aminopeptidase/D-esterase-like protein